LAASTRNSTSPNKRFTRRRSSGLASVKHQSALCAFVEFYYSTFLCGRSYASLLSAQKRRKPSTLCEIKNQKYTKNPRHPWRGLWNRPKVFKQILNTNNMTYTQAKVHFSKILARKILMIVFYFSVSE
jgi:hypothetical protein